MKRKSFFLTILQTLMFATLVLAADKAVIIPHSSTKFAVIPLRPPQIRTLFQYKYRIGYGAALIPTRVRYTFRVRSDLSGGATVFSFLFDESFKNNTYKFDQTNNSNFNKVTDLLTNGINDLVIMRTEHIATSYFREKYFFSHGIGGNYDPDLYSIREITHVLVHIDNFSWIVKPDVPKFEYSADLRIEIMGYK